MQLPLLVFGKSRASCLDQVAARPGELDFERTAAEDLKPVMKDGTGSKTIGAKTGAGIVDLEKLNVCASAIFDGCVDVVGVAAGEWGKGGEENDDAMETMRGEFADHLEFPGSAGADSGGDGRLLSTCFSRRSSRLASSGRR